MHFSNKPKFYEVSCLGNPCWKTESFCSEIPREEESYFAPCFATFLKEDQTLNSLELSMDNFPRHSVNSSISYGSRVSTPSSYPTKPPRQGLSPSIFTPTYSRSISRKNSIDSLRGSGTYSPCAEQIIEDQSKMLAQLQAQIQELQAHVFKPKLQRNLSEMMLNHAETNTTFNVKESKQMSNAETNTTFVSSNPEYMTTSDLRGSEDGFSSVKSKSFVKTSIGRPPQASKTVTPRQPIKMMSTSSEEQGNEASAQLEYNPLRYSSMEFQDSPGPSPHPFKSKVSQSTKIKQNSFDMPYSDRFSPSLSKRSEVLKMNVDSSTEIPSSYQKKLVFSPGGLSKNMTEVMPSDQTICVPKIEYESSSEGSDDDHILSAIEKKYLR